MCRKKKLDNYGYSLTEILIVVAIMAIAVGLIGISISLVYSRDSEKCAKEIDAAIESARMNALTKPGEYSMRLTSSTNTMELISSVDGIISDRQLQSAVDITYEDLSGSHNFSSSDVIEITFAGAAGKVNAIKVDGVAESGVMAMNIHCTSRSGKRVSVVVVRTTGKHYLDYSD